MNFAPPSDSPDSRAMFQLNISTESISLREIETVLCKLNIGKAAGIDGIHPELLKYDAGVLVEPLSQVLIQIWDTEDIPTDWKKGVIVKLFKTGGTADRNHWRGITLQFARSKVLYKVILNRIQIKFDSVLRLEQHDFRPSRSCSDLIFSFRILIEESNEWQTEIIVAFIDILRAFDFSYMMNK